MNGKFLGMTILFLSLLSPLLADEIHLKEGKVLSGKITHESDEEYTIRLGKGMVLRVLKKNAAKVIRSEPAVAASTTTIPSYQVKSVKVSTVAAPASLPSPGKPVVDHLKRSDRELHGFQISEVRVPAASGKTKSPYSLWDLSWSGKSGQDEGAFKWVSGVVVATVTVPAASEHEMERQKIWAEGLTSFVETLHHLRSNSEDELKNESDLIFKNMKERTEKRWQGYLRRTKK